MKKKFKRLKLVYVLPNFDLGADTHFYHLFGFIKEIAAMHDVFLIVEKGKPAKKYFKNICTVKNQIFHLPVLRVLENFYFMLVARIKGYKIFYIHYSYPAALCASVITKLFGGRVFYWNCEMIWEFGRSRLLEFVLSQVDFLITGTESLKLGYVKYYGLLPEKVKVMPNWLDLSAFEDKKQNIPLTVDLPKNKKIVLFLHRLSPRKGSHYLKDIARALPKNAVLAIAGQGPYLPKLKEQIKDWKLDNVILLGAVANQQVPALLNQSEVLIMPSEQEGFPRVLLEAMATGKPYVAFDVGGVQEIIPPEQKAYIFAKGDVVGLVEGLKQLLADQDLSLRIGRCNQEWVKRYDLPVIIETFNSLFF